MVWEGAQEVLILVLIHQYSAIPQYNTTSVSSVMGFNNAFGLCSRIATS